MTKFQRKEKNEWHFRLNSVDASETFVEEGENLMKRWPLAVRSPTLQHQIHQFLAQIFRLG